jgi:L,D-transpeptidase ErfK/SrfK
MTARAKLPSCAWRGLAWRALSAAVVTALPLVPLPAPANQPIPSENEIPAASANASASYLEAKPRELPVYELEDSDQWLIGTVTSAVPARGETFLEIGHRHDLGYNEMIAANRNSDPWIPKADEPLVIPTRWLVPEGARSGIVLNIPEMRLYLFRDGGRRVITAPVGLGREDWKTPQGAFKVSEKDEKPTWVIPETIRKERIEEDGSSEYQIAGGDPENPLGRYRLKLTIPTYGIHGSNKEWGVGMLVSHGCLRLYNEDIATLFPLIDVGTPGAFVYEPVKVGKHRGRVLVEVHEDIYGFTPALYNTAEALLKRRGWMSEVDPALLEAAIEAKTGVPTDVSWVEGATASAR